MLDVIKGKIATIASYTNSEFMSSELQKLAESIEKFQSEDVVNNDLHRTFRMLDRYAIMYKVAVDEYMALPTKELEKRSFKLQDILSLLTLMTSLIAGTLRKYNTNTEDKGTVGKYIRTLTNNLEQYRNDKISWTTMLKATTTMIEARITKVKERMQERTFNVTSSRSGE